jgi:hypothetical protein
LIRRVEERRREGKGGKGGKGVIMEGVIMVRGYNGAGKLINNIKKNIVKRMGRYYHLTSQKNGNIVLSNQSKEWQHIVI